MLELKITTKPKNVVDGELEVIMAELIGCLMLTLVDAKTQAKTYTKVNAKTEAKVETHAVADLPTLSRQAIVAKIASMPKAATLELKDTDKSRMSF